MGRNRLGKGELGTPGAQQSGKGLWQAWARFGDQDGSTRVIKRTGRTKAIAIRAVEEAAANRVQAWDQAEQVARADAIPTIGQLAERWFKTIEPAPVNVGPKGDELLPAYQTGIRRQTFDQYRSTYRNHIYPALGELKVADVGTKVCAGFLEDLVDGGTGLTRARLTRVVLKGILNVAVQDETIPYNPINNVNSPKRKRMSPQALDASSMHDVRKAVREWRTSPGLFGPANDGALADIVDLLAATGVRIGEALALRWTDVNLEGPVPTVFITGTIVEPRKGPKYRQAKPKSMSGYREIPIPPFVVDMLLRRRIASPENNLANAVFWSNKGTFRQPSAVRRSFRSSLQEAGLELDLDVTPHTFRKTVATILAREVGAEAARSVLGHSSLAVTERSYIQRPERVEDHRATLAAFLESGN